MIEFQVDNKNQTTDFVVDADEITIGRSSNVGENHIHVKDPAVPESRPQSVCKMTEYESIITVAQLDSITVPNWQLTNRWNYSYQS